MKGFVGQSVGYQNKVFISDGMALALSPSVSVGLRMSSISSLALGEFGVSIPWGKKLRTLVMG